ncbi:MAG: hypothetical protein JRH07_08445 [Deltaproteobacteria bacterium]|nr:hypothetical protein [Deltaproteobacteria bacterium]MBW2121859.1 hypothetical protein [Deltaproteobacteria bacterium]
MNYWESKARNEDCSKGRLRPFEGRVSVEPEEVEESRTKNGIIIPDTVKKKPRRGKVVEAGIR